MLPMLAIITQLTTWNHPGIHILFVFDTSNNEIKLKRRGEN